MPQHFRYIWSKYGILVRVVICQLNEKDLYRENNYCTIDRTGKGSPNDSK